jgi:hypothetical protein
LFAAAGDRWPFTEPFCSVRPAFLLEPLAESAGVIGVMPLIRLRLPSSIGLRLLVRARFSRSELELSSSIGGGDGARRFARAAERVTGPKWPSRALVSEGVGEGDITRGVLGIWYCFEDAMACLQQRGKDGRADGRMRPDKVVRAWKQKCDRCERSGVVSDGLKAGISSVTAGSSEARSGCAVIARLAGAKQRG